jgi:hypothetical protein
VRADLAEGRTPSIDLTPFRLDRLLTEDPSGRPVSGDG